MNDPFFLGGKKSKPTTAAGSSGSGKRGNNATSNGNNSNNRTTGKSESVKRKHDGNHYNTKKDNFFKKAPTGNKSNNSHKSNSSNSSNSSSNSKNARKNTNSSKDEYEDENEGDLFDDDDDENNNDKDNEDESEDEEDYESAAEKRVRLAKLYINELEEKQRNDEDDFEVDRDAIAHRLQEDALEKAGKLQKEVAFRYENQNYLSVGEETKLLRGHDLAVTCLCVTSDDKYIFTGGKDSSIIKWDAHTGAKLFVIRGGKKQTKKSIQKAEAQGLDKQTQANLTKQFEGHVDHILALAVSSDSKYLASGGRDNAVFIWDVSTCALIKRFEGHRDAVSGLAFRRGAHELYSASFDRTIKVWNLDEMTYVETLFGHQDAITALDCLSKQRPISSGGRDKSIRAWKIIDESQLVFNGTMTSIDTLKAVNEDTFFSGSEDGGIALWNYQKKKPVAITQHHIVDSAWNTAESLARAKSPLNDDLESEDSSVFPKECWVSAVATFPYGDLVASGANDGIIRLWKCANGLRTLVPIGAIPVLGFINALAFSNDGTKLIVGIGQEHRLGRWFKPLKFAKNGLKIIPLLETSPQE